VTGRTTSRGYGSPDKELRRKWKRLVDRGDVSCARCRAPIVPGEARDLGHVDDDRSQYAGQEHRSCNRAAGAAKGNRARRTRQLRPQLKQDDPDAHVFWGGHRKSPAGRGGGHACGRSGASQRGELMATVTQETSRIRPLPLLTTVATESSAICATIHAAVLSVALRRCSGCEAALAVLPDSLARGTSADRAELTRLLAELEDDRGTRYTLAEPDGSFACPICAMPGYAVSARDF
jgi:hypothetical protein